MQRTDFQLIESLDEVVLLKTHNSSNHVAGFRQQMKASSSKKKKLGSNILDSRVYSKGKDMWFCLIKLTRPAKANWCRLIGLLL